MPTLDRTKATLLAGLLLAAAPAALGGNGDDGGPLRSPLLRYKLELASQDRPYVHVLPEVLVVSFRGIEMKRLPVSGHWRLQKRLLELGRVRGWNPRRQDPMLLAGEDRPVDALIFLDSLVTLDKMPPTFSVLLEDGTLVQVTADEKGRFHPQRRRVPLSPDDDLQPADVIHLTMSPEAARQFYWLLEEGLAVIY